jgi:hypothetical protein
MHKYQLRQKTGDQDKDKEESFILDLDNFDNFSVQERSISEDEIEDH